MKQLRKRLYQVGHYTEEWGQALERALAADGGRRATNYIREAVAMRLKAEGFWEGPCPAMAAAMNVATQRLQKEGVWSPPAKGVQND